MTRIPTNGNRNTAASSHALNVGAQTPMRGANASPTPTEVPFRPLASAYVRTELMKANPTRGPIIQSSTHHAREARSSRHSFSSSQRQRESGKRKENLFEGRRGGPSRASDRGQLGERPFAADSPAAQKNEPIADPRGVSDLMDREKQRP